MKAAVKAKLNFVRVVMLNSTLLGHDAVSIGFMDVSVKFLSLYLRHI